jgi:hypothetical protein
MSMFEVASTKDIRSIRREIVLAMRNIIDPEDSKKRIEPVVVQFRLLSGVLTMHYNRNHMSN